MSRRYSEIRNEIYGSSRRENEDFQSNFIRDFDDVEQYEDKRKKHSKCHDNEGKQAHTHEYLGSTKIAEREEDPHNHRFAGVTGEAIPMRGGNHFHKLKDNTDFYENHFHIVADNTGPAIPVGNGRHVHFVNGQTTVSDGHRHEFQFATLIDNPIGD